MGKTKKIILSQEARAALDKAYRFGSCHRFRMRCKAVMMKADKVSMPEICKVVGYGKLAYTIGSNYTRKMAWMVSGRKGDADKSL